MRKSLFVCVMMFAVFSTEKAMVYDRDLFGIQKNSFRCAAGSRTDSLEWWFKDPSLAVFLDEIKALIPGAASLTSLENVGIALIVDQIFKFDNVYKSQWKHLNMITLGLEGRGEARCGVYWRAEGNYGWIGHGRYDPKGVFSGSTEFLDRAFSTQGVGPNPKKNSKGHEWDASVGIGYNFKLYCNSLQLAPTVGWSYCNTHFDTYKDRALVDVSGNIDIPGAENSVGLSRLFWGGKANAWYHSYWTGPWGGLDALYHYDCSWSLFATFAYHFAKHVGKGSAGSANTLVSSEVFEEFAIDLGDLPLVDGFGMAIFAKNRFKNHISMQGYKLGGGIHYTINDCRYVGFKINYWHMEKMRSGLAKVESDGAFLIACGKEGSEEESLFLDLSSKDDFCLQGLCWKSLRCEIEFGFNF